MFGDSVHGRLAQRQEHPGESISGNKEVSFMGAGKQSRGTVGDRKASGRHIFPMAVPMIHPKECSANNTVKLNRYENLMTKGDFCDGSPKTRVAPALSTLRG